MVLNLSILLQNFGSFKEQKGGGRGQINSAWFVVEMVV
jgi:hypothetical protein